MKKLLYKPLSIGLGVAGGAAAGWVFNKVWKAIAGKEEAPNATSQEYGWAAVLGAAALQGAIFSAVKAAVDRGSAAGVRKLTGEWPT